MPERILFLEGFSALLLFTAQKTHSGPLINMIYKLGLLYDKIMSPFYDSALIECVYRGVPPYAEVVPFDMYEALSNVPPPTREKIAALRKAYSEPEDLEGCNYAYYGVCATLLKAAEVGGHFYVPPRFREGFLAFCQECLPEYLDLMKQSFLCFDILDLIFSEQISSFNPEQTLEQMKEYVSFKKDFQNGVFNLLDELSGYYLSNEQKEYIRRKLSMDEQQLLYFLKPENLNKFNLDIANIATEVISILTPFPIPMGVIVNVAKEIKEIHEFKEKNLNFILSIYVLKKLASSSSSLTFLEPPQCKICSLSEAEIEAMSEEECDRIAFSGEFCEKHIIAYLTIRKMYALTGKKLLLAMKKFD